MFLLDLFCGAGGAAYGYYLAGFPRDQIVGVDIHRFRHYPFKFIQGGAFELLPKLLAEYPITHIHASPPCHAYSVASKTYVRYKPYADYIAPIRNQLELSGLPYVIENVEYAPLIPERTIMLCGSMDVFQSNVPMTKTGKLRVLRHRLFESNVPLVQPQEHLPNYPKYAKLNKHPLVHTNRKSEAHYGKLDPYESFVMVAGGGNAPADACRDAMGIDWMNRDELCEAIPPVYTRYVGEQLIAHTGDIAQSEVQLQLF